jgi:uncharacterized membrane protein YgdD (TMEM256/DUF423 family)
LAWLVSPTFVRRLAAVFGFLAVGLGAFGAHALKGVTAEAYEQFWRTATLYHLIHSVALLALSARPRVPLVPVWAWSAGMVMFCGSLYVYPLWHIPWLMFPVTPLGGIAFLIGWGCLIFSRGE